MGTAGNSSFRADIEGLRALAILLVVGCHCSVPGMQGGFVGVDVFFTLSGFLVTGLLLREAAQTGDIRFADFYARRARRLLPGLAVVLLATLGGAVALLDPLATENVARATIAAALYGSNLYFDHQASDYFSPSVAGHPLLHSWSLGVEEQFYLVWPWLVGVVALRRSQRTTLLILVMVFALSLACCLLATPRLPQFAFYELPSRAWEFAAGGLLAMPCDLMTRSMRRRSGAAGTIGLALIVGAGGLIHGGSGFPGWRALAPVMGTVLLIGAGRAETPGFVTHLLAGRASRFIGARSYAWYLWHWPVLCFARVVFPDLDLRGRLAAAAGAFALAALQYRWVEQPVRSSPALRRSPRATLLATAATTLLALVLVGATFRYCERQKSIDARFAALEAATADVGNIPHACWSDSPSFAARQCDFGALGSHTTLALFGDSHAMQWVNPFQSIAREQRWHLVTLVRPGCAASDINPRRYADNRCRDWRREAMQKLLALHPALVVMVSFEGQMMRPSPEAPELMTAAEVMTGTREIVEQLTRAGIRVAVLRDSPLPPLDVPGCVARHLAESSPDLRHCDFEAGDAVNEAAYQAEQAAVSGLPGASSLDMDDVICPQRICRAWLNGQLVYRDADHLTGRFTETLAPVLAARIGSLLPPVAAAPAPAPSGG